MSNAITADDIDRVYRTTMQSLIFAEGLVDSARKLEDADVGWPRRDGTPRVDEASGRPWPEFVAREFITTGFALAYELESRLEKIPRNRASLTEEQYGLVLWEVHQKLRDVSSSPEGSAHARAMAFCFGVLQALRNAIGFDRQSADHPPVVQLQLPTRIGERAKVERVPLLTVRPRPSTEAEWQALAATIVPLMPQLRKQLVAINVPDCDEMRHLMVDEKLKAIAAIATGGDTTPTLGQLNDVSSSARSCWMFATLVLGHADAFVKPDAGTFNAVLGLYGEVRFLQRAIGFRSDPLWRLLRDVADSADRKIYSLAKIPGETLHEIALRYAQAVQEILRDGNGEFLMVGKSDDDKTVADEPSVRDSWPSIGLAAKKIPRFDYEPFLTVLGDEATRARLKLVAVDATTQTSVMPDKYSPWIGSPKMIDLMKANGIRGTGDRAITRKKQEWQAEPQVGTHNRLFRFRRSVLRELGIKYPPEWDDPPT